MTMIQPVTGYDFTPTPRKGFTPKQRAEAFLAAGGKCQCGCGEKITGTYDIDHILPLALGGKHEPANWRVLIPAHHKQKTAQDIARIAKADRQHRKAFGERPISRMQSRPFPKDLRKKLNGKVVKRGEG